MHLRVYMAGLRIKKETINMLTRPTLPMAPIHVFLSPFFSLLVFKENKMVKKPSKRKAVDGGSKASTRTGTRSGKKSAAEKESGVEVNEDMEKESGADVNEDVMMEKMCQHMMPLMQKTVSQMMTQMFEKQSQVEALALKEKQAGALRQQEEAAESQKEVRDEKQKELEVTIEEASGKQFEKDVEGIYGDLLDIIVDDVIEEVYGVDRREEDLVKVQEALEEQQRMKEVLMANKKERGKQVGGGMPLGSYEKFRTEWLPQVQESASYRGLGEQLRTVKPSSEVSVTSPGSYEGLFHMLKSPQASSGSTVEDCLRAGVLPYNQRAAGFSPTKSKRQLEVGGGRDGAFTPVACVVGCGNVPFGARAGEYGGGRVKFAEVFM